MGSLLTNSVSLEAQLVCPNPPSQQCALTISRARGQGACGEACIRAPLSGGQSWIETVTTIEQRRSEPSRPDYEEPDGKFRLRTLKIVLAVGDGGMSVVSVPLEVSAPLWPRRAQNLYPSFNPGALIWPSELLGHGGRVFADIVRGRPVRLVSRKATRHRLGPAHVFEVADGEGDSFASCGGLATTTSESVEGTITVLDDTLLIVAAKLVDDESEVNDRRFQDELEDGGTQTITAHWVSGIHRTVTIDVSCGADASN